MSARYRIAHPPHGVTDVFEAEPRLTPVSTVVPAPGRFSAAVYFAAAEMLALDGHVNAALRAAERGMRLDTPEPDAQALYAWLLYRGRRASANHVSVEVWDQIDRALARNADCALAHYFKSVLLQRSGRAHEARVHLQRGRALDPTQTAADRAIALLDDE